LRRLCASCARSLLGTRCRPQLGEEISNILGQHPMLGSKGAGFLSAILLLRA
jgi:hypothetical protein